LHLGYCLTFFYLKFKFALKTALFSKDKKITAQNWL